MAKAPRQFASTTIQFRALVLPVRLYSAIDEDEKISFKTLHKKCGRCIKRIDACPLHGFVGRSEIGEPDAFTPLAESEKAKGYEIAKDQFVELDEKEVDELVEAESPPLVVVYKAVPFDKIPILGHESTYYLGPEKGSEAAYVLIAEALRTRKAALIAKSQAKGQQHLVAIAELEHRLVMYQLHWTTEIRSIELIPLGHGRPTPDELKAGRKLVDAVLSQKLDLDAYRDEVQPRIREHLDERAKTGRLKVRTHVGTTARVIPLDEALAKSIAGEQAKRETARELVSARGRHRTSRVPKRAG